MDFCRKSGFWSLMLHHILRILLNKKVSKVVLVNDWFSSQQQKKVLFSDSNSARSMLHECPKKKNETKIIKRQQKISSYESKSLCFVRIMCFFLPFFFFFIFDWKAFTFNNSQVKWEWKEKTGSIKEIHQIGITSKKGTDNYYTKIENCYIFFSP